MTTLDEMDSEMRGRDFMGEIGDTPYYALALCGEAGEVAEKVKKWLRDDRYGPMNTERREGIRDEIGDVLFYLSRLADSIGYSTNDCFTAYVAKSNRRRENGTQRGDGDFR